MEPACLSGSGSGPSLRDTPMSARRGLSPAGRGKPHADQAESSTIAEVRRPSAIEQISVCNQTNSAHALSAALAREERHAGCCRSPVVGMSPRLQICPAAMSAVVEG